MENGHFLYLAILLDLYSRRIVGWELRDHMKESLVLAGLKSENQTEPTPGMRYCGHPEA